MEKGIWTSLSLFLINISVFKVVVVFLLDTERTSKYICGAGFGACEDNFFKVYFSSANVYWAPPLRDPLMKMQPLPHLGDRQVNDLCLLMWYTKQEFAAFPGGDYPSAKNQRMIQHLPGRWEGGTFQAERQTSADLVWWSRENGYMPGRVRLERQVRSQRAFETMLRSLELILKIRALNRGCTWDHLGNFEKQLTSPTPDQWSDLLWGWSLGIRIFFKCPGWC